MSTDTPRCQAVTGVRPNGSPMRCSRPIQYIGGAGVFEGWEHVVPDGGHTAVPDPDWEVDHEHQRVVRKEERP